MLVMRSRKVLGEGEGGEKWIETRSKQLGWCSVGSLPGDKTFFIKQTAALNS